ncbi:MAG TPA: hypothetical protein VLT82_21460 [Myxococcaceae bacterium]|nr:hypothetical protein [Myxococcaceae bacterium]
MHARRLMAMVLGATVLGACGGGGGGTADSGTQAKCTIEGVSVTASATAVPPSQQVDLGANVKQGPGATGCNGGVIWSSNPAGAITGTQPLAAHFATANPGNYTVTATSVDDPTKSGSVQISVQAPTSCGTPNGTVLTHSGNITASETWAGNGVTHSVTASVRIKPGATVTVEPCAIVAVASAQEIGVEGDPSANGATAKLVAAGTDLNHFVSFVPAAQGQTWAGIRGYNVHSLVELHYTGVVSAGAGPIYRNSAIVMQGPGLNLAPQGVLTADNLVVENPVGGGVYLDGEAAFTPQSTYLGVTGAQDHPLAMHIMAVGSMPLTQVQNSLYDDALMLTSAPNVTQDTTIHGYIPLYFEAQVKVGQNTSGTTTTLTVEGGSVLRFAPGNDIRMYFGNQSAGAGILRAAGDATQPIVFTSAAGAPAAGDWAGLLLLNSYGSQLSYVTIEYAGASNGWVSANCRPSGSSDNAALLVADIPVANFLTNSTIQNVSGHGIDATWVAATVNEPDVAAGNTFNNVTGCKQTHNARTGGCGGNLGCTE